MEKQNFKFILRKKLIAIKRNYYVIPLFFVFLATLQFLCSLFIFSPAFSRLDLNFSSINPENGVVASFPSFLKTIFSIFWPYNCIFLFIITLFTILYSIAYLQYTIKKYGEKRPVVMLIIFFTLWTINLFLLLFVFKANQINLYDELLALYQKPEDLVIQEFVSYARQTNTLLLIHIILSITSGVFVATAPFVQKQLKKVTFKAI